MVNPIQMPTVRKKTNEKRRNEIGIQQNLPGGQHAKQINQLQLKLLQPQVFFQILQQVPDPPGEY